ncbi:MAG: ATP-dependent DNA ligase [Thermofilaceae archaeon]|nr:ATP-dependent DNA ligase [Thermofilaceae archaeon]MCX8181311.1 ATP-dependent DNA ligase [Thermofilaceae archaeon]MDW8004654.1 ATP-dependent DNA ligase [Thermofilaceae archaeon]
MSDLEYSVLVDFYEKIEATSSRLTMTDLLVSLFRRTPPEVMDKVVYLTRGTLGPDYEAPELGVAEKLTIRAVAQALGLNVRDVEAAYKKRGDIGLAAEELMEKVKPATILDFFTSAETVSKKRLTVGGVYDLLLKIAKASGPGAQETKISTLVSLLKYAQPKEARYLLRTVTGKLRLGVADMTILDALAVSFIGSRSARSFIERAYNVHPDLGYIAKLVAERGVEGIKEVKIRVGVPVKPMLAERLSDPAEIIEKLGGSCLVEYKYDGERVQAHKRGSEVFLFSRRLENITNHYPDVVEMIRQYVKAEEVILEGEVVALNPDTGEMLPFQDLMHRRRKYEVEEAMEKYPAAVFLFDILYLDGRGLIDDPLPERRRQLEDVVEESERLKLAKSEIVKTPEELIKFFEEAVSEGCEGVMCKSLSNDSIYQMGARGWLWVKFKRDYRYEMTDTVDLVVVGAFYGKGKRAGTYGALLMAAYSPEEDVFKTVCKVGSGFSDDDLAQLPKLLEPYRIGHRHPRVVSRMEADVWFTPFIVLEVIGAEITLSPLHTCALGRVKPEAGLAIRFPRFTGRYRTDKKPEDATTEEEIVEMFKLQRRVSEPVASVSETS